MVRERTRPSSLATGPDPFSDTFESDGASRGRVEVVHGVYAHSLPLVGMTVRQARSELEERMNIAPDALAVVDGVEVSEDTVLHEGQVLNFVKHSGEKGSPRGGFSPCRIR
jgi:hypothetical protein